MVITKILYSLPSYNFGNLLTTTASVGSTPLSPNFISAGAGPALSDAD